MLIKSISKITAAAQLPEGWFAEKNIEETETKRKTGYLASEELDSYLKNYMEHYITQYMEQYMERNFPKFFDAYLERDFKKSESIWSKRESDGLAAVLERVKELEILTDKLKSTVGGGRAGSNQNSMCSDILHDEEKAYVLGSYVRREEVSVISFGDQMPQNPSIYEKFWDVSEAGDESVMAYAEKCGEYYEIKICGVGGVTAPVCCADLFRGYHNLSSIDFRGVFDTSQVVDMRRMFCDCRSLSNLDVSGFYTAQVIDMGWMFYGCRSLTELDASKFDTAQVTDMESMFSGCESLINLDVGGFATLQVMYMNNMFYNCRSLRVLDISKFNTSQVTNMSLMFAWCENLTELDVSGFDTSQVEEMDAMFWCCESLTELDVNGFDISKVKEMDNMFYGCSNLQDNALYTKLDKTLLEQIK